MVSRACQVCGKTVGLDTWFTSLLSSFPSENILYWNTESHCYGSLAIQSWIDFTVFPEPVSFLGGSASFGRFLLGPVLHCPEYLDFFIPRQRSGI